MDPSVDPPVDPPVDPSVDPPVDPPLDPSDSYRNHVYLSCLFNNVACLSNKL